MSSSGRPRHPDILTPRQWEVLALIREGLTNEQIAERLDISLDGAKFHVSEILGRLDVSSREEASAWRPEERKPWWVSGLALLGWPFRELTWTIWAKAVGAAVVVAAVGGIGVLVWAVAVTGGPEEEGAGVIASPTRTPVPWVDSTPGPMPSPSPTPFPTPNPEELAVRPCRAEELDAAMTGGNGAGGWVFWYLGFSNRSETACRLQGVPAVHLVAADGRTISTARGEPCLVFSGCAPGIPALLTANGPTPNGFESPGQAGVALMFWGRRDWTPCARQATSLAIDLPEDGGHLTIPLAGVDGCIELSVSQFSAPQPPPTPAPSSPHLAARLSVPPSATAGQPLDFEVKLTNQSTTAPFVFGNLCPNYVVIMGPKEAVGRHLLNCRPVAAVPPGETVSFAMKLAIPADTPPGSYPLDWTLEGVSYVIFAGAGSGAPKTPYSVTVTAP